MYSLNQHNVICPLYLHKAGGGGGRQKNKIKNKMARLAANRAHLTSCLPRQSFLSGTPLTFDAQTSQSIYDSPIHVLGQGLYRKVHLCIPQTQCNIF